MNNHQIEQKLTQANPVPRPEHLHEDASEARALFALILEKRDNMTVTQQPAPTRPSTNGRWRPALVAVAAAFLVLVVVGVAAIIGLTGTEEKAVGQSVTTPVIPPITTISPTTTTTTTTAAPVVAPPITRCEEEYSTWLSLRGRDCDLVQGENVPTVFGPLLDGGWFDLTDLRGRPAVVLTFVAAYGPGNRDAIAEFQVLYEKWSDRVGFVSISEDTASVAQNVVQEGGFTFPVVTCFSDNPPEPHAPGSTNLLCGQNEEESLWVWWGNQDLPSWTVLDSDGRFVDLRLGGSTTLEDIDSLLASVVGS
ncbi:MAG: redoxin domain-containing protein [Acidimicrobiia bacterium]